MLRGLMVILALCLGLVLIPASAAGRVVSADSVTYTPVGRYAQVTVPFSANHGSVDQLYVSATWHNTATGVTFRGEGYTDDSGTWHAAISAESGTYTMVIDSVTSSGRKSVTWDGVTPPNAYTVP